MYFSRAILCQVVVKLLFALGLRLRLLVDSLPFLISGLGALFRALSRALAFTGSGTRPRPHTRQEF
jgi:hypothetical protein